MTTTEKNKLIAEFMGMVYDNHDNQPNKYWEITDEQSFVSNKPYPQDKDLKFNSSWDWLMPVVEKIESLGYWVEILGGVHNVCKIGLTNDEDAFIWSDTKTKIESVYNACIEFILWCNQNKVNHDNR